MWTCIYQLAYLKMQIQFMLNAWEQIYTCAPQCFCRLIRGAGRAKSGGECNCGCSEPVPWHAVTPGWLAAQWGGAGSPAVPVIGMLEYCSVTVRAENKEAVERIEREHVPLPAPRDKVREGESGGVLQPAPTRHVSQPGEQWHASPPAPARARFHQTTLRMWLSILSCMFCLFYNTQMSAARHTTCTWEHCHMSHTKGKQPTCNTGVKKFKVFPFFSQGKTFLGEYCSLSAESENPHAGPLYADSQRKAVWSRSCTVLSALWIQTRKFRDRKKNHKRKYTLIDMSVKSVGVWQCPN